MDKIEKATIIQSSAQNTITIDQAAVALINPKNCVNCGKCREMCPTNAIEEKQRVICRICPECTEKPALTIDNMVSLATETSCTVACPLGVSPQGYVGLMKAEKPAKALNAIWEKNPLPSVCGYICHHPCEEACKRGLLVDSPISIKNIKRHLAETIAYQPDQYPQIYEESIAVLGSGPAGLTAAHYLATFGYEVTIYDSEAEPGGMLKRAIPEFRLPRNVLQADIDRLEHAGIEFCMGETITPAKMKELKETYDRIVVAAGRPYSNKLNIEGKYANGIMTALEFTERINGNQEICTHPAQSFNCSGDNVVVIGGGDVAMDCARMARRLGAKTVTAVCMESGGLVPAHEWELQEAQEEGVTLMEGWAPAEFLCDHLKLNGLKLYKTASRRDETGKIQFAIDHDETQVIRADWVIVAIGQREDGFWHAYENDPDVFFAGDIRNNPCSVVDAMTSGKKAAFEVDANLRGRPLKDALDLRKLNEAPAEQKIFPATRIKSMMAHAPMVDPAMRVKNFDVVELGLDTKGAILEANRCLQCGYQAVNTDKCIGCGVCKEVCPKGDVITLEALQGGRDHE